jgi:hypothetical protein
MFFIMTPGVAPESSILLFPTYHLRPATYRLPRQSTVNSRRSAAPLPPPTTYDLQPTFFIFNNIPAFSAQLPLFSLTFPLNPGSLRAGPLFSMTFPHCSFTF